MNKLTQKSVIKLLRRYNSTSIKSFDQIPGPEPLPIIGNIINFIPGIGEFGAVNFEEQHEKLLNKYGELVRVTKIPGNNDMLFIFRPEDIETVFNKFKSIHPLRPPISALAHYRKVIRKDMFQGAGGLTSDQGEEWWKTRSLVNPILMKPSVVRKYATSISQVAQEFVDKIPKWGNEMPKDFFNELNKWALESIALVALDTRLGCLADNLSPDSKPQKIVNAARDVFQYLHKLDLGGPRIWKLFPTPTWKKFESTMDFLTDVYAEYINEALKKHKAGIDKDSPSVLLKLLARNKDPIRAIIMAQDMLIAGIDTTSGSITNILLCLCENQEKQEKLYNELIELMPDPDVVITEELLDEMTYLRACIRESMRLRPIVALNARVSHEDFILSGYLIPKGVDLLLVNAVTCRMEKHFPKATEYIPERWFRDKNKNPFADYKVNPYVSLPFGHGSRMCIGKRFASLEIEILLAKLIRKYKWEWNKPPMKYKSSLVQSPIDPLQFTVHQRHSS